jgi:uncharacterized repeat protein (TIGR01451 family)
MSQSRIALVVTILLALLLNLFPALTQAAPFPTPEFQTSANTLPLVAIHVSEHTQALDSGGAWYTSWHYFVMYESLKEALRSDGTPFVEISDAQIAAGELLSPAGTPKYPILISLASEAIDDDEIEPLRTFVAAGGFLFVGSSAFTRNTDGTTRGDFALADEMGLHMVNPNHDQNWYQNTQFSKALDHRLVSHIPWGTLTWYMPLDSEEIPLGITGAHAVHGAHDVWQVTASDAEVIANGESGPLLTTGSYGQGHFIYHGDFNPLIGHGGNASGMYAYVIYRNAIEWAFESFNLPIIKLSPWRYAYDAALIVRHDFENTPSRIQSIEASAQAEASVGAKGEYYFCTGTLREDMGDPSTTVASLRRAVSQYGATIGSHNGGLVNPVNPDLTSNDYDYWHWGPDEALDTTPPGYADGSTYAQTSISLSFQDIEGWLAGLDNGRPGCGAAGNCPRTWVSPYFNSARDGSYDILAQLGAVTVGEQKISPFPHWTVSYKKTERYPHVTLPTSDWYIGTDVAQSMEAGHTAETVRAAVDFYDDLGALVNLYSHSSSQDGVAWEYVSYAAAKPRIWATNSVGVYDWWVLRSPVMITPSYSEEGSTAIAGASVSGATDPETAIELAIPHWDSGTINNLEISLNGVPADSAHYRTTAHGVKVKVGAGVSNVEVRYTPLAGWVQTDWDGGPGQPIWADETRYDSASGIDDSRDGQVRLGIVSGGNTLLADDFSRPPDTLDPLLPWVNQLGTWTVADQTVQAASVSGYSYIHVPSDPPWTDYTVEGRIQFPAGAFGGGIGGRLDPATGAHYGAWIYPDGSPDGSNVLKLIKFRDWTHWNDQPMGGQVSLPSVGTGWHTLQLNFQGNRIRVTYDGSLVIDVTDDNYDGRPAYLSGGVSVGTWSGGGSGYAIKADDILVRSPAQYGSSGQLLSSAFDGGVGVNWQNITWNVVAGGATGVRARTRAADQVSQLATAAWSDWYTSSGSPVTSQDKRWIQYELELTSSDSSSTPIFYENGITYIPGVQLPASNLIYTGPVGGDSQTQVVLSAVLRDETNSPISGQVVDFTLHGANGLLTASGTTSSEGEASTPLDLLTAPGQYSLTVAAAGDSQVAPTSTEVAFLVTSPWPEWTQRTQADFEGNMLSNVDVVTQPGSVILGETQTGYVSQGEVLSTAHDTGQFSTWKYLTWEATTPTNTGTKFQLRTAATQNGLEAGSWMDYDQTGRLIGNQAGRWVQYRAILTSTDSLTTPQLHQVTVYYTDHPASLAVTPDPETAVAGEVVTYTANIDDGGHTWDVTGETTFSVEAEARGAWASNVYTSQVAGGWTVTGQYLDMSDTARLTVGHATAVSITVTPAEETVTTGENITYTVDAEDAFGNTWDGTAETQFSVEAGAGGSWLESVYTSQAAGDWTVTAQHRDGMIATATLHVQPLADLRLTKRDSRDPVSVGDSLVYTITIVNYGPSDATAVTLIDHLPAEVTLGAIAPSQGNCSGTSVITCSLDTLTDHAMATVTIAVTPTAAGLITNTSSVTQTEIDPNPPDNTAEESTRVTNPLPTMIGIDPESVVLGSPGFTLVISGTDFVNGAVVKWDDATLPTTFVSSTKLLATVVDTYITAQGAISVTVVNPAPEGGTSNSIMFEVTSPEPAVRRIYLPSILNQ